MNNPLISVIIPVYNVEAYLEQCLDSVINNTYKNLEIICVNDGSPDNSQSILERYAAQDDRIKVIVQQNMGLSAARNSGLRVAMGQYVAFVDSDDVVSPVLYEKLVWALEKYDADIVATGYTHELNQVMYSRSVDLDRIHVLNGYSDCLAAITMLPSIRSRVWIHCTVWNKLYRRDKGIPNFNTECLVSEDLQFNWEYLKNCEKMVIVPGAHYFWRENPTSLSRTPSIAKKLAEGNVWMHIACSSHGISKELKSHIAGIAAYYVHNTLWRIFRSGEENDYERFIEEAKSIIYRYFWEFIKHPDTQWKVRIPAFLFRYCFPLWKLAAKHHRK